MSMSVLSAAQLLDLWGRGQGRPPAERALMILEAAYPDLTLEALASLPIGRRDRSLLLLREQTFGRRLDCQVRCSRCGEQLEPVFSVEDIKMPESEASPAILSFQAEGYIIQFRLPGSRDLSSVERDDYPGDSRRMLLERCLIAVSRDRESICAHDLPESVVDALSEEMSRVDPQGHIRLAISCPVCGQECHETFDIVSYFWSEISAWAARMLREVHALACAYGWCESEILALSPWRRQAYIAMVGYE